MVDGQKNPHARTTVLGIRRDYLEDTFFADYLAPESFAAQKQKNPPRVMTKLRKELSGFTG